MRSPGASLLWQYARHWWHTWPRRARELLAGPGAACWQAGYGAARAPWGASIAEGTVRIAELVGVGLLAQVVEWIVAGHRYRVLSDRERAFAKTYFTEALLTAARIDARAGWTTGGRVAAYVFGRVVKAPGPLPLPVLVHELTHVAQFGRWGWAYVAKALWAQHRGAGYRYVAAAPHAAVAAILNAEQEAARVEDLARLRSGVATRWLLAPDELVQGRDGASTRLEGRPGAPLPGGGL